MIGKVTLLVKIHFSVFVMLAIDVIGGLCLRKFSGCKGATPNTVRDIIYDIIHDIIYDTIYEIIL